MNKFMIRFESHIILMAFPYVILCYFIFVALNKVYLKIEMKDPYYPAMCLIGLFWLAVMKLSIFYNKRYNKSV